MKKYMISIIVLMAVFALTGCGAKDQETFFIPTPMVTPEPSGEETPGNTEDNKEPSNSGEDDTVYEGNTTPMFVKLGDYDAILNVRSLPSKDGEIVGFLVHTEQVEVIDIDDGWARIVFDNKICYVSAGFLVDKKPAYIAPPTPTKKPSPTPIPDPSEAPPEI